MSRVNEFRIGNWVSNGIKNYTVDSNMLYDFAASSGYYKIEPILITQEILESSGFKMIGKNDFVFNRYSIRKEKRLDNPVWEVYILGNDGTFHWLINIKHIHELQNLFYSLTKQELEINI